MKGKKKNDDVARTILGGLDLISVGRRLAITDKFLFNVMSVRLATGGLSDDVAENKRQDSGEGVYQKRRPKVENARINSAKNWAKSLGMDPNFVAQIMYALISESCRVQDELMCEKFISGEEVLKENKKSIEKFQRENLLKLTDTIAEGYDEGYSSDFFGTKTYLEFEKETLFGLIGKLKHREHAIDLGCATGIVAHSIAPYFATVAGYDISPKMIAVAKRKKSKGNVKFIQADIEKGLNLKENTLSLVVMNFGTASDIRNIKSVLRCIKHALHPDGKFFLSFYNSRSLLAQLGFLPWQMPLAAHIDREKNSLEVQIVNSKKKKRVYFIYAKPYSVNDVKELLKDFCVDKILTFPTCASVLPNIVLEEVGNNKTVPKTGAQEMLKKIDEILAPSNLNTGTYIIVTGSKK